MHHSKKIQPYVEKYQQDIEFFYLPIAHPQELVNQELKANASNCVNDLLINIRLYLTKIQFNEFKIFNFLRKMKLNMLFGNKQLLDARVITSSLP